MESLFVDETGEQSSIDVDLTLMPDNEVRAIGATNALNSVSQGGDPEAAFELADAKDSIEDADESWMMDVSNSRVGEIEAAMDVRTPDETLASLQEMTENTSGNQGEEGKAIESTRSIPQNVTSTEEEIEQQALDTLTRHAFTKYADTETGLSTVSSFLGTLIPERQSILFQDVLDELGFTNSWLDTVGVDTDEIRQFRNFYEGLNTKNKARVLAKTLDAVDKHGDNPILNSNLIGHLFAPTFEGEEWQTFFNLLDLTVVADIGMVAKVGIQATTRSASILNAAKKFKLAPKDNEAVKAVNSKILSRTEKAETKKGSAVKATDNGDGTYTVTTTKTKTTGKGKNKKTKETSVEEVRVFPAVERGADARMLVTLIRSAVKNPEQAEKVGITPAAVMDAQDITIPASVQELMTGAPENVAGEVRHLTRLQDERLDDLIRTTQREGVLTPKEQANLFDRTEVRLAKDEDIDSGTLKIEKIDETSYRVSYNKIKRDSLGRKRGNVDVDEVKYFQAKDAEGLSKEVSEEAFPNGLFAFDPNARGTEAFRERFVTPIERLGPQQSRWRRQVDEMLKEAFKDLDGNFLFGKKAGNVNDVLLLGDEVGEAFTWDELVTGGKGEIKFQALSDKEAKAYMGVRNLLDRLGDVENTRFVDNMNARGVKLVEDIDGSSVASRTFDDQYEASVEFWNTPTTDNSPHINIMDGGLQKLFGKGRTIEFNSFHELTEEMMETAYKAGYQLVKNDNASRLFVRNNKRTQWALVKNEKVLNPSGKRVINRRAGYIPKERKNGAFYIKESVSDGLSGNKNAKVMRTVAYSDNFSDAQKHVDSLKGEYKIFSDRELSPEQAAYDSNGSRGGLYSGARKTEEIEYVGTPSGSGRKGTMEALQGYINHIGKQYPINLFRLGIEARALKTARALGLDDARNLEDLITKGSSKRFSHNTRRMFKDMHDQIAFLRNIPTSAEVALSNQLKMAGKSVESSLLGKIPGYNRIPRFFYNTGGSGTQPQDVMRGLTFNTLLGMWNPAQLFVQASGMFVSAAVNPVHFARSIPRAVGYHTLDLMDDVVTRNRMIKWMEGEGALKEYAEGYEIWRRSGLADNIVNSNADYTSVFTKQLPYDAGVVRKFLSNHTWFYKQGELANTRMAYSTAYEWFKHTDPITNKARATVLKNVDPDDAATVNAILKRTEMNRLNMSRANQSDLNKGWKSVPLQFQQVISKYYEKVMPQVIGGTDELLPLEKMRLFTGTTVITGATGVPFAEAIYLQILDWTGTKPQEIDPETATAFKYGALGWTLTEAFNLNIDISTRSSLGKDGYKVIMEGLRTGVSPLKVAGGPTFGVSKRAVESLHFAVKAFDIYSDMENETTTYEDIMVIGDIIQEASLNFITVAKNMKEYNAYLFGNNPKFRRKGQYLIDFRNMNEQTAFFGMLGFQTTEMSELYEIRNKLQEEAGSGSGTSPYVTEEAKMILWILNTKVLNSQNEQTSLLGGEAINTIMRNKTPSEAVALYDRLMTLAWDKKLDHDNLFYKYVMEISDGVDHGFGVISNTMSEESKKRRQ